MKYNLKEQLFDKIGGLELVNPDEYGAKYNKGVREAKARVVSFFNKELVSEVPQCVIDWYEENKDDFETNLFQFIESLVVAPCEEDDPIDFIDWLIYKDTKPFQTLVNMHQFGYEVEKEKRYLVKMKGLEIDEAYLKFQLDDKYWYMGIFEERKHARVKHTKTELEEAGFEDVFNSPLFKVEEVE